MYGSILFNCWGALIGFTIYFCLSLQNKLAAPLTILTGSFITAVIVFILIFFIRMFLSYILFTPDEVSISFEEQQQTKQNEVNINGLPMIEQATSNELGDTNSEEIAKAVRTMMHSEPQHIQS